MKPAIASNKTNHQIADDLVMKKGSLLLALLVVGASAASAALLTIAPKISYAEEYLNQCDPDALYSDPLCPPSDSIEKEAINSSIRTSRAIASKVRHSLINGQPLYLDGNVMQAIKFRAKTLTAGACGLQVSVNTSSRGGRAVQTQLLAPPIVWSRWVSLEHAVPISYAKVSFRKVCSNVPVVAEVKYIADPNRQ
ncbi:hypothetical protein PMIT1313_00012 [Prochlorococcus marinus str. MIT 1313]|uniref:hypothetical protein n=1 Tax=Prochlorococcus TaxID=1218 RepID=UPI0007B35314|nr:hypothetical protein [Prochlorococcus marinus]KZR72657.1 hypothetical protein PMIT1313_00012 [Prochlorococcus marinus str. MIT 1313]KZR75187.1 hypothetical protein PMIT1318_00272 [Prochlorococcus marinus str. MIT 1318]